MPQIRKDIASNKLDTYAAIKQHMDQDETIYFKQQLEQIKLRVIETLYPEIKIRRLLPVDTTTGPGAVTVMYKEYNTTGRAKVINDYAKDSPNINLVGQQVTSNVKSIGAHFYYSFQDIRSAMFANVDLSVREAREAAKAIYYEEEEIGAFGSTRDGLNGFVNHDNINETVLPSDGANSSKKLQDKTSDDIIRDISNLINSVATVSLGTHMANTFLCPVSIYTLLNTRPKSTLSDFTVMRYLKEAFPMVVFEYWEKLKGRSDTSTDIILAYERSDINSILECPMPLMEHPPIREGLGFRMDYELRTGGSIVYKPKSIAFAKDA